MDAIRNNPVLAIILVLVALLLVGASFYWTFMRTPSAPELPIRADETAPPPMPKEEGPGIL